MANGKSAGLVFLVLILLLGGVIAYIGLRKKAVYDEPQPQSGRISAAINIDVYLDGSGSMRNFLLPPAHPYAGRNYFDAFLRSCEETLREAPAVNGWFDKSKTVRFWKFGSAQGPVRLADYGALSDAARSPVAFFTEKRTFIEKAVDHTVPDGPQGAELKIIITDLYQSDTKMELIVEDIANRFLANGKGAVAVYGVRNPYSGAVEDVPGLGERSLPNAATSMPFYIIVAGENAADVRHLQEALETRATKEGLSDAASSGRLFAEYFSKDPGEYVSAAPTVYPFISAKGEDTPRSKSATEVTEANYKRSSIGMLYLRHGRVRVTWPAPPPVTSFGLTEEAAAEETQPRIRAWIAPVQAPPKPGKEKPAAMPSNASATASAAPASPAANAPAPQQNAAMAPQQDSRAVKAVSNCTAEGQGLCVLIDAARGLQRDKKYLFEFDRVADSRNGYKHTFDENQELMKHWNLNSDETQDLITKTKFQPNPELHGGELPGKTPSLSAMLKGLQGAVFQIGNEDTDAVRVATYYLYVEVNGKP